MASKKSKRWASIARKTKETDIELTFDLDGNGKHQVSTGVPFLDHMLSLFAKHGRFDLTVKALGDVEIDAHHTVEDVGICLGNAFHKAIGEAGGIRRYGHALLPMEEALAMVALDISGRSGCFYELGELSPKVGEFDVELVPEFFRAFSSNALLTMHIRVLSGVNTHHILESAFKGFAVALRNAVDIIHPTDEVPSTKGVI